jgi:DNA repair protein RadC
MAELKSSKPKAKGPPLHGTLFVRDGGAFRPARAREMRAAITAYAQSTRPPRAMFDNVIVVGRFLQQRFFGLEHEEFAVAFLDCRHRLLVYEHMFRGTIDGTAVYPREIVKRALVVNASAVVLAHNHPSGNDKPSSADLEITRHIESALQLIGVRVLDHFVVTDASSYSFVAHGHMVPSL